MATPHGRRLAIMVVLAAATVAVYAPVVGFDFVNFDDPEYVTQNAAVQAGFDRETVWWAFTGTHARLWHPLTSLAHVLDWQLFGAWAGGHHLVNMLWHLGAGLLLFIWVADASGHIGRAGCVAGLVLLHPLRVESVAWVSERKDVLSVCLAMATMAAYVRWADRRGGRRWAIVLLATGAMLAKAMMVTLPLLLLLLDVWPLGRSTRQPWRSLVCEKLPLLALSVLVAIVTFHRQLAGGAVVGLEALPLAARLAQAPVAAVTYLYTLLWPVGLAVFYPWTAPAAWAVGACAAGLGLAGALVVRWRSRVPHLMIGYGWYLLTLLPVIGLLQAGSQGMADRFTYLPSIGLAIALVWTLADGVARFRVPRWVTWAAIIMAGGSLAIASRLQLRHWRDSETLFTRALAVTHDNYLAHTNLGEALTRRGDLTGARSHYEAALTINPRYAIARGNLGNALARSGDAAGAEVQYRAALGLRADLPEVHNALGVLLAGRGDVAGAIVQYREALAERPGYTLAQANLADALRQSGLLDEAIAGYQAVLVRQPGWDEARFGLALALADRGRPRDAAAELRALRSREGPLGPAVTDALAWLLATTSDPAVADGPLAVTLAEEARSRGGENPRVLDTLGAALAAAGRFPEAVAVAARARVLAADAPALAEEIAARQRLYEAGKPFRASPAP